MSVLRADHLHAVDGVGVCRRREGRPLDGGPLLTDPVVPENNLAGVGTAQDQVRVESGERGRHDLGLTLEDVLRR